MGAVMAVVAALGLMLGAAFAVSTDGSDDGGVMPTADVVGTPELGSTNPNVLSVAASSPGRIRQRRRLRSSLTWLSRGSGTMAGSRTRHCWA